MLLSSDQQKSMLTHLLRAITDQEDDLVDVFVLDQMDYLPVTAQDIVAACLEFDVFSKVIRACYRHTASL